MKVSELEALQRIEKPTDAEKARISFLRRQATTKSNVEVIWPKRRPAPPISEQLDLVQEKFGKKIEPWSVFVCTDCKESYHLSDGAKCECGKVDSDRRQNKYLGEFKIGSKKVS